MPTKPKEMLFGPQFKGPMFVDTSKANSIAGKTTLASGSATAVVSTNQVNSDSLVFLGQVGYANLGSGDVRGPVEVKTIVSGVSFTLGVADGVAMARDTIVHWMILKTTA